MKFIDTSLLIDILRKNPEAKSLMIKLDKSKPHVTNTIVVHEFLVGAYGHPNQDKEYKIRENFLKRLIILNLNYEAAKKSAEIEASLRKKGKIIGGADVLIAGTMLIMLSRGITTIITRNKKHFLHI